MQQQPDARILSAVQARARILAEARRDFVRFVEMVAMDEEGNPITLAPLHRAWVAHILWSWERGFHAMVIAPFGHGKSSSLVCPILAWELGRNPQLRAKIVANDDASARRRVAAVKRIMETPTYRAIFPNVQRGEKWTEHELYLQRKGTAIDPSLQARGVFSYGIGSRADLMVFDDPVDQKNSMEPSQRRKVIELIENTWLTRLTPNGRVAYCNTLWHLADATHVFMMRKGWATLLQRVADDCGQIEQELVALDAVGHPVINEQWVGDMLGDCLSKGG